MRSFESGSAASASETQSTDKRERPRISRAAKALSLLALFLSSEVALAQNAPGARTHMPDRPTATEQAARKIAEMSEIEGMIGIYGAASLFESPTVKNPEELIEKLKEPHHIEVTGFEQMDGSNAEVKELLRRLPKFLTLNTKSIEYKDLEEGSSPIYEMDGDSGATQSGVRKQARTWYTVAEAESSKGKVRIYKNPNKPNADLREREADIIHKLFHPADPQFNKYLTVEQRVQLERDIDARAHSAGRHRYDYVESIASKDPTTKRRLQNMEYWAKDGEACISGNEPLAEADMRLVEDAVHNTDPDFKCAQRLPRHSQAIR